MDSRESTERTLLAGTFLFRDAPREAVELARTDPRALRRRAARGEVLYDPRHFQRSLGVVLEGRIQVNKGPLIMSVLGPGELFGAAALFNDRPDYATTLTARTNCRILFLPQEDVDRLLGEEPLLRRNYLRYLSGRIRFLSGRLGALAQTGAEGKLARYLLSSGEPSVHAPATDLAKRLGLSRASLYRAFEALESAGLIRREGKTVFVLDRGGLEGVL